MIGTISRMRGDRVLQDLADQVMEEMDQGQDATNSHEIQSLNDILEMAVSMDERRAKRDELLKRKALRVRT